MTLNGDDEDGRWMMGYDMGEVAEMIRATKTKTVAFKSFLY